MNADRVRDLIRKVDENPASGEVLWRMRSHGVDVTYGDPSRPFFIASATKLFVTAILAQLREEGRLDWDAPLAGALADLDLTGLHLNDQTSVRSVMAHTSGLADYFEDKRPDGPATFARALEKDFGWDVTDVISWTRTMKPATAGKGHYSDTGYQLLGALIERLDARSFADSVAARIAEPLGLTGTYCFSPDTLDRYDSVTPMFTATAPCGSRWRWPRCRPTAGS